MEVARLFAIECAPGAESTCEWAIQESKRYEQVRAYRPLLIMAIILFLLAIVLIAALIAKNKRDK